MLDTNTSPANLKELTRIRKLYPLFQFEIEGSHVTAIMTSTSQYHFTMNEGRWDNLSQHYLNNDHMKKSISIDLMKLYPDLYISVFTGTDRIDVSVWVKRNSSDAEAVGHISIVDPNLHITLKKWQTEANLAVQDNWFFCTGHVRAEPKSDFDYFHFAGKYCKLWGRLNPASRKMAINQNYD